MPELCRTYDSCVRTPITKRREPPGVLTSGREVQQPAGHGKCPRRVLSTPVDGSLGLVQPNGFVVHVPVREHVTRPCERTRHAPVREHVTRPCEKTRHTCLRENKSLVPA